MFASSHVSGVGFSAFGSAPTRHVYFAGVGSPSKPPTSEAARTSKVCRPVARFEYIAGLKHSSHISGSRLSRRHSYSNHCGGVKSLTPLKLKRAERLFVCAGGASTMTVSGGSMLSALRMYLTGVGSMFPARSIARTSKFIIPSSNRIVDHGLEQP